MFKLMLLVLTVSGADPWWSTRPLEKVQPPKNAPHPVDAFLLARLAREGIVPTAEVDRATLYRRLCFDLTGLPPAPQDSQRFISDSSPDAIAKAIDTLLRNPAHGERMARLWLDVAHYGDTHGYDKDKQRPNAWPYRDWLIRAFNANMPYKEFTTLQIAGDMVPQSGPGGIEALGFLAAGPWDFIGHAEVPESKIDGKIARHLDRDDMVATVTNTFMGTTVQCAQCHDHKFDPVTQADYYRLQAVFAAIDRADRPYYRDPAMHERVKQADAIVARLVSARGELTGAEKKLLGPEGEKLTAELARLQQPAPGKDPRFGWHSQIRPSANTTEWVQVDLGETRPINSVVLHGCHDDFAGIGAGFGFPSRYRITCSDDPEMVKSTVIIDHTSTDVPNPGLKPLAYPAPAMAQGRYVRLTVTRLATRQNDFIAAVAEMRVLDAAGKNYAAGKTARASSSIEAGPRWAVANITDGAWYGGDPATRDVQDAVAAKLASLRATKIPAELRNRISVLENELAAAERDRKALPAPSVVYAGTVHSGSGAFMGTGPSGKPRPIHLLKRGNIQQPQEEVQPAGIAAFNHAPDLFNLKPGHAEGERRLALARWIAHDDNPLYWRVMANRVWRWHFGRGLVETPNDLGRMGDMPEHRELLDYLAGWLRDQGGSLHALHKLLLTSTAYRRAATNNPEAFKKDPDNRLWWHGNRRKLDAEALRDAMLATSGTLDTTMFGPPFQDFVITHPEHSPHYEYDKFDPASMKARRRSVYRFIVRSQQQPFMTVLDCADPSLLVDRRNETNSPLQALALLNNDFVLVMARDFATRVDKEGGSTEARIQRALLLALGRPGSPDETRELSAYATRHGMPAACRVIFNTNAFAFVD